MLPLLSLYDCESRISFLQTYVTCSNTVPSRIIPDDSELFVLNLNCVIVYDCTILNTSTIIKYYKFGCKLKFYKNKHFFFHDFVFFFFYYPKIITKTFYKRVEKFKNKIVYPTWYNYTKQLWVEKFLKGFVKHAVNNIE